MKRHALVSAGAALTVLTAVAGAVAQDAVRIRVNTAGSAAMPSRVPSAIFTGVVKQVMDGRTVLVQRNVPPASSVIGGKAMSDEGYVPVRLYGVAAAPPAQDAAARQFLQQIVGKPVRIAVRGGTSEAPHAIRYALVYVLPDPNGGALSAPPPLAEQKAPPVTIVPTRTADASNTSPDMLRGPVEPNIPTAPNIPVPPAGAVVRADDCVNYAVVRQGLARWDKSVAPNDRQFTSAKKDAQKSRRGLWSTGAK